MFSQSKNKLLSAMLVNCMTSTTILNYISTLCLHGCCTSTEVGVVMVQRVKVKSLQTPESHCHRMCREEATLRHSRVQLDLLRYYKNIFIYFLARCFDFILLACLLACIGVLFFIHSFVHLFVCLYVVCSFVQSFIFFFTSILQLLVVR